MNHIEIGMPVHAIHYKVYSNLFSYINSHIFSHFIVCYIPDTKEHILKVFGHFHDALLILKIENIIAFKRQKKENI